MGDRDANRPSGSMQMQMNAYRWLAEPRFRTRPWELTSPSPTRRCNIRRNGSHLAGTFLRLGLSLRCCVRRVRGIVGAHSAYAGGKGSVADYVKAAKAAGLSFLVFNRSPGATHARDVSEAEKRL